MLELMGLGETPGEIRVHLRPEEQLAARQFFERKQMNPDRPVIGLNLGAGTRWRWKRWTPEGFLELGRRLWQTQQANLLILSGPDEARLKDEWIRRCIYTWSRNRPI